MKPRFYIEDPRGHEWQKDEDDTVDIFAMDDGIHNGPKCVKCGYSFCHHCDDFIPKCRATKEQSK